MCPQYKGIETMELKFILLKRNISQIEISTRVGVHPSLISLLVNHNHPLPEAYTPEFCRIVGIDLIDFLNGKITEISH